MPSQVPFALSEMLVGEARDKRRFTQSSKLQRQRLIANAINTRRNEILARRQQKRSQKGGGGLGGAIGTGLGAIAGYALAPFTGGMSAATTAALKLGSAGLGASIGGSIGQAFGGGVNPGADIQQSIKDASNILPLADMNSLNEAAGFSKATAPPQMDRPGPPLPASVAQERGIPQTPAPLKLESGYQQPVGSRYLLRMPGRLFP